MTSVSGAPSNNSTRYIRWFKIPILPCNQPSCLSGKAKKPSIPQMNHAWDPPPSRKLDCLSFSRTVPHLHTTVCCHCIPEHGNRGVKLVHCSRCSVGYLLLTGTPLIWGPCRAKGIRSSPPDETQFPQRNYDLASEQESEDWGGSFAWTVPKPIKPVPSVLTGGSAQTTPGGFSARQFSCGLNVTAWLVIFTAPVKFAHNNGVGTYSNIINVSDNSWPDCFGRAAWAAIAQYCHSINFPLPNLCHLQYI
ncbi:uncharacterized protein MELLADRAFT_102351 [Melampsora larici-populina 98AG31]|uniref:Uncharacterized protein n=1 Tax=Melampsora larici-populina (strain 98AG31 / pathotype 3-4-7) TaxID=747676 RepID=F4R803_MELLP|nr:uncharacterized protein MELLADRAFT_102351 [Melampsora larici-populina 98AG31]EGG11409.1 hypothetical protein MELLADRAFT_102351 [Melampsora larici-populina 98AG31]